MKARQDQSALRYNVKLDKTMHYRPLEILLSKKSTGNICDT